MKTSLEWMELAYEADFSVPLFDLPGRNTEVLRYFHRFIHPRFPLRTPDMQVMGGNALSDVCVRLTMFGGSGTIEVTADKLSMRFTDIRREQDVNICSECVALVEQALKSALPDLEMGIITIRPTLSLRLADGSIDARDYLKRVVKPGVELDLRELGTVALCPCINLEVENRAEGWRAVLHAYDNTVDTASIIVSGWIGYLHSPEDQIRAERVKRLRQLLTALLRGLDLELTPLATAPTS